MQLQLVEHVSDERDYGLILPPLGETLIPGRFCESTRSKERDKESGAFAFYVNEGGEGSRNPRPRACDGKSEPPAKPDGPCTEPQQ